MTKAELLDGGLEKISQAAKRLGIDRNTLYRWMHEDKVPFFHLHGIYRIPRRAVDDLLTTGLRLGKEVDK